MSSPTQQPNNPLPQSPSLPTNPTPPIIQALSYSPLNKKTQPIPWSHQETLNLIKAYQEKWYSLKRGQLKASQWEEVSITIAARCGLEEPSKTGTQCRHKIEKLRKRYRQEKLKLQLPPSFNNYYQQNQNHHPWIYFSLMDQLDRGPLPISVVNPLINCDQIVESDDEFEVGFGSFKKLRCGSPILKGNFDGFLRKLPKSEDLGNGYLKGGDFNGGFSNLRDMRKRKGYYEEDEEEGYNGNFDDDVEEREMRSGGELGGQIREFAERFVRMESKKIELMKETEKLRMEMENKKMKMIIVAQHNIVELISRAFNGGSSGGGSIIQKKMKINSDL